MSGTDRVVADTSVIVAFLKGDPVAGEALIGKRVFVSVITEIELLSYSRIREVDMSATVTWLKNVRIVGLTEEVKAETISIRRSRSLKLPDGLIAATAISLGVPLLTGDRRFAKCGDRLSVTVLGLSR
jgi:predicted nucleic acid-binding protein